MKKLFIGLMLATAFISCDKKNPTTQFPPKKDIILTKTQTEIAQNNNTFSFNLLKKLYTLENEQELFISPFSMDAALSMLSNGAGGDTFTEIAKTLGYENYSAEDINETYQVITKGLLSVDSSTKLAIANALWLGQSFPVIPTFSLTLANYYNAQADNVDFSSPSSLETINKWADANTNGMIPKIMEDIDPQTVFVLANALYFKGIWSNKFKKSNTTSQIFHCLSGKTKNMDFMKGDIPCKYSYSNELQAALCELPFGNEAFALDILLPDDNVDLNSLIAELDGTGWKSTVDRLSATKEYVEMPKLDLTYSGEETMKQALESMGIEKAFESNNADFSKISAVRTFVSKVIQKTRFKMDEDGAEAAAVTVANGNCTSAGPSPRFIVDHPFVFAIRETSTSTILFLGAYRGI